MFGQKDDGFGVSRNYKSEGFDEATSKLNISLSYFIGDIKVLQGNHYFENALDFEVGNINPESDKAVITLTNKVDDDLEDLDITFSSIFFEEDFSISLEESEKTQLEIILDKEKMKGTVAGSYIVTADITKEDAEERT